MKTLKEIEARLAQIKNELHTRAAELTEDVYKRQTGNREEHTEALGNGYYQ